MLHRLRSDFPLALMTFFGVITMLGILPFAFYRFATGQELVGLLDLAIVASIFAGLAYAWVSGRTEGPALVMAVIYTSGCVLIAHVGGLAGLLWVYPTILANFLLVRRGPAVLLSVAAIGGISASDPVLTDVASKSMFVATALVTSLFAYVFASRSDQQRRQLEAIAAHDPLTGAYNRRGMESELDIAMAASQRQQAPLGLLVFDLDHFKRVNDNHGHEAGDAVLVQVADLVNACTRKGDRFVRLGGEEFGLLIPAAGDPSLRLVAEKLRAAVEREVHWAGERVTISIGATWYVAGEEAADFMARADNAMYAAKRAGRNRVVVLDGLCAVGDTGDRAGAGTGQRPDPDSSPATPPS